MKKNLVAIILCVAFSNVVHAEVLIDNPADCYRATPSDLSQALSTQLCQGAISTAPAECYKATPSDLTRELSVQLCKRARTMDPINCYNATPSDLSRELSVKFS